MTNPTRIEVLAPVVFEHLEFAQLPENPELFVGKATVVHLDSRLRVVLGLEVRGAVSEELEWLAQMRGFIHPTEPGKPPRVLALPVRRNSLNDPKYSLITGSCPAVLTRW